MTYRDYVAVRLIAGYMNDIALLMPEDDLRKAIRRMYRIADIAVEERDKLRKPK